MKNPFSGKKKKGGKQGGYPIYWGPGTSSVVFEPAQEAYKSLQELEQTTKAFDRIEFMDTKRAEIALKFVRWYLVYVLVIILGVPLYNAYAVGSKEPIDIYKLLTQVGTLLGTPLGFVVGYYFKEDKHEVVKKED